MKGPPLPQEISVVLSMKPRWQKGGGRRSEAQEVNKCGTVNVTQVAKKEGGGRAPGERHKR